MLEYVYTQKQYKRTMTLLLSLWAINFVCRAGLFILYGMEYAVSSVNLIMIFVSGILVGLIIRAMIIRKKSVGVPMEAMGLDPVE